MAVFMVKSYFSQLLSKSEDAARIDGCSEFGMSYRVMLPLARQAITTIAVLSFMGTWNEFRAGTTMAPLPDMRKLPAQIFSFAGEYGVDYALVATPAVISAVPVLVLYAIAAERFVEVLTVGGLKG